MDNILYIIRSMIALILVIWLANVGLKYLNKLSNNQAKSLQIIERISLSKSSSLAIVKIVNTYYVMSFSQDKTEKLHALTDEEAKIIETNLEKSKESTVHNVMVNDNLMELKNKFTQYFNK